MTGVELIAAERERQVSAEGWTPEHDATHDERQLVWAAMCYAGANLAQAGLYEEYASRADKSEHCPANWPWEPGSYKPANPKNAEGQVRNLAKAGALIAAEIDRLVRDTK